MRALRSARGFTLLEVLIAMVIMVGGVIVVANAWSSNFYRVRTTRINNSMAVLLERKMTEIEVFYKEKPLGEIKEADAGDFGEMYPGFTWEMTSKEFEMPDMSGPLTSRDGGADEMTMTIVKTMTEFISDSVREVTVTVSYKPRKGKTLQHSVTQYFVDYTKELPLPGMPAGAGGGGGGAPGGGAPAPGGS